jgi:hypothetical protein
MQKSLRIGQECECVHFLESSSQKKSVKEALHKKVSMKTCSGNVSQALLPSTMDHDGGRKGDFKRVYNIDFP